MIDNLAPDISGQINTNFMEERILEHQTAYPSTHMQLSKAVEAEMSDGEWMAKEQLMKPVQLAQVTWATTQARDTSIYNVTFPAVLSTIESLVVRTLHMYSFYKLSPCFKVQVNSTQFHQGQLICSFDPFSFSKITNTDHPLNYYSATGLPNVKIMASESDPVELCIPFIHPRSFLTTNSQYVYNDLGTFDIRVLNPLLVAEGSTPSLTVTIWMYATHAQVHVPINEHTPILVRTSKKALPSEKQNQNKNRESPPAPALAETTPSFIESLTSGLPGFIENVKTGFGQATSMIGNFYTGNFGQALRKGQGLIDTLGNVFGFDYPARTVQPDKTISPIENLSVGIGKSQSQRMAIDPFSMHILKDDVASESLMAMDLKRISQTPMLINQFVFPATSPVDSLLFSCPVHPAVCASYQNNLQRTYLAFVANAFTYWSGGLIFDIEIVATRFHSGKLLFAYVPNDLNPPTYISAATSLPNVIVDIQQTSTFSFKIPFTSSTPMKNTAFSAITDDFYNERFCDAAVGTLVCYVQNALANASNVAPSVEINVYLKADSDYSLYVPKHPRSAPLNAPTPPPSLVRTSGIGILEQKNAPPNTSVVLSKDQNYSIPRTHFGEDYSLIDILRRFSYLNNFSFTATAAPSTVNDLIFVHPNQRSAAEPTYLSYFSGIYSAWSGSIRFKVATYDPRTSQNSLTITHIPNVAVFNDLTELTALPLTGTAGFGTLRTTLSQDNAIELEVPYYSQYNMLLTRDGPNTTGLTGQYRDNGFLYLTVVSPDGVTSNVDYYISVGEDFRYLYLRSPPADGFLGSFSLPTLI